MQITQQESICVSLYVGNIKDLSCGIYITDIPWQTVVYTWYLQLA